MGRSNLTIGALDLYQSIDAYGKANTADTITIAQTLETATITALGSKAIAGGDLIKILPVLVSGDGAVGTATETLTFDVTHYVYKAGFKTVPVSVTFSTTAVDDINTALATAGLNTKLKAELVGTKLRLIALVEGVGFKITGGTGLTSLKLTVGNYGKTLLFKVATPITGVTTSVPISEKFSYGIADFNTVESLTGLQYIVERWLGESESSTLDTSLTSEKYYGSNKTAVQVEYSAGDAKLDTTNLVFSKENLEYIKGFKKRTVSRTKFSGKPATATYKYGAYCTAPEFKIRGYAVNRDGIGLKYIEADRCKAMSTTIPLGKMFRVSNESFKLLADTSRSAVKIYEL